MTDERPPRPRPAPPGIKPSRPEGGFSPREERLIGTALVVLFVLVCSVIALVATVGGTVAGFLVAAGVLVCMAGLAKPWRGR